MSGETSRPCVLEAWEQNEVELHTWLVRQVRGDVALADDLLQTVFLKALRQGQRFCDVEQSRSWLFTTARHTVVDHFRLRKQDVPVPETLTADTTPPIAVDSLVQCLPRALAELDAQDTDVLRRCDLEGMTQAKYAQLRGLSLPGVKSRLQRARRRLQAHITRVCQVQCDENGHVCCFVPRTAPSDESK